MRPNCRCSSSLPCTPHIYYTIRVESEHAHIKIVTIIVIICILLSNQQPISFLCTFWLWSLLSRRRCHVMYKFLLFFFYLCVCCVISQFLFVWLSVNGIICLYAGKMFNVPLDSRISTLHRAHWSNNKPELPLQYTRIYLNFHDESTEQGWCGATNRYLNICWMNSNHMASTMGFHDKTRKMRWINCINCLI